MQGVFEIHCLIDGYWRQKIQAFDNREIQYKITVSLNVCKEAKICLFIVTL